MMELGPVRWPLLLDERGRLERGLLSRVGLELMHELNAGGKVIERELASNESMSVFALYRNTHCLLHWIF